MAEVELSEAERTYVLHGVQDDLRVDGRCCGDYRHMEVETGVVSNTNGSARLRLANTDILVGIKVRWQSLSTKVNRKEIFIWPFGEGKARIFLNLCHRSI